MIVTYSDGETQTVSFTDMIATIALKPKYLASAFTLQYQYTYGDKEITTLSKTVSFLDMLVDYYQAGNAQQKQYAKNMIAAAYYGNKNNADPVDMTSALSTVGLKASDLDNMRDDFKDTAKLISYDVGEHAFYGDNETAKLNFVNKNASYNVSVEDDGFTVTYSLANRGNLYFVVPGVTPVALTEDYSDDFAAGNINVHVAVTSDNNKVTVTISGIDTADELLTVFAVYSYAGTEFVTGDSISAYAVRYLIQKCTNETTYNNAMVTYYKVVAVFPEA